MTATAGVLASRWLASMVDGAGALAADTVSGCGDVDAPVGGGPWTIRMAAVHLVGGLRMHRASVEGAGSPLKDVRPATVAAFNAGLFLAIDERDPAVLAHLVREAAQAMAAAVEEMGHVEREWHAGTFSTGDLLARVAIGELLLHGWDIAQAASLPFDPDGNWAAEALGSFAAHAPGLGRRQRPPSALRRCWLQPDPGTGFGLAFDDADGVTTFGEPVSVDAIVSGRAFGLLRWTSGRGGFVEAELEASGPAAGAAARVMGNFFAL